VLFTSSEDYASLSEMLRLSASEVRDAMIEFLRLAALSVRENRLLA